MLDYSELNNVFILYYEVERRVGRDVVMKRIIEDCKNSRAVQEVLKEYGSIENAIKYAKVAQLLYLREKEIINYLKKLLKEVDYEKGNN